MGNRLRSTMWKCFTKLNNEKANCNICGMPISYKSTVSNLKMHLRRKHASVYTELIKCMKEQRNLMQAELSQLDELVAASSHLASVELGDNSLSNNEISSQDEQQQVIVISNGDSIFSIQDDDTNNDSTSIDNFVSFDNISITSDRIHNGSNNEDDSIQNDVNMNSFVLNDESNLFITTTTSSNNHDYIGDTCSSNNNRASSSISNTSSDDPNSQPLRGENSVDRVFLNLFILDYHSFRMVNDIGFRQFLMNLHPGYDIPSKKIISSVLIPSLYNEKLQKVKDTIHEDARTVCITIDCWASTSVTWTLTAVERYIAISAHYIDDNFQLKSFLLKCCSFPASHTTADLATAIKETLANYNLIDKVNLVVSDNSFNIDIAVRDILQLKYYSCYADRLNHVLVRSFRPVQPILDKIRAIVAHFNRTQNDNDKLIKHQLVVSCLMKPKYLKSDYANQRWNSTYHMLKRFVCLTDAVKTAFVSLSRKDLLPLTGEEWEICQELCDVLNPFDEMIKSMNCDQKYMTGSSVIVVTRCLKGTCERLKQNVCADPIKRILTSIKTGLDELSENIEKNSAFALSTLLDPRYKEHVFEDEIAVNEAKNHLQDLVTTVIERNSSKSNLESDEANSRTNVDDNNGRPRFNPWSILNDIIPGKQTHTNALIRAINEIDLYMRDEVLPRLDERGDYNCPLEWWKRHQYIYPNLLEIFQSACSVVATGVPCQEYFSKIGHVLRERRAALEPNKLEMVVFLNGNSTV